MLLLFLLLIFLSRIYLLMLKYISIGKYLKIQKKDVYFYIVCLFNLFFSFWSRVLKKRWRFENLS